MMTKQISPWVLVEDGMAAVRHVIGEDPDDPRYRVALIEKTPRVRIRPHYLREHHGRYEDGETYIEYKWDEHLDWCYGDKGDGPEDEESRTWCDNMLIALGYKLT